MTRAEKAAALRGLYGITAERLSNGRDNLDVVRDMLDAGVKILQYREKDMPMLRQYQQCVELRRMTAEAGALLIIDDYVDLALAVGADGVHIGQDDLPIEQVRKIAGEDMLIGLSTHSPEQARDAVARGADYIGVGPLFETRTKDNVCAPVGLSYLDYVVENIRLPFVAIGGIKEHNLGTVLEHGASCVAIVTGIVGVSVVAAAARGFIARIGAAGEAGGLTITVNGQKEALGQPVTLLELLRGKGVEPGTVVVEIRGDIPDRSTWGDVPVRDGDTLEILKFMGGGAR